MAKKFQFRLEPVLTQRRAQEESCQRDLAKSLRQRMILQDQLQKMQHTITQSKQQLADGLVGAVDVGRISEFTRYSGQVTQRAHAFVMKLAGVEQQIQATRNRLMEATRARKALELLRQQRYQQWKRIVERQEARQLDEIASMRYAYNMIAGAVE